MESSEKQLPQNVSLDPLISAALSFYIWERLLLSVCRTAVFGSCRSELACLLLTFGENNLWSDASFVNETLFD